MTATTQGRREPWPEIGGAARPNTKFLAAVAAILTLTAAGCIPDSSTTTTAATTSTTAATTSTIPPLHSLFTCADLDEEEDRIYYDADAWIDPPAYDAGARLRIIDGLKISRCMPIRWLTTYPCGELLPIADRLAVATSYLHTTTHAGVRLEIETVSADVLDALRDRCADSPAVTPPEEPAS